MSIVERLVLNLREAGIPLPTAEWKISRLRAGRHQRSAGAWSWRLIPVSVSAAPEWFGVVGSQFTATACAKGPVDIHQSHGLFSVYPREVS